MKRLEIRRQVFHILLGIITVGLIYFNILTPIIIFWVLVAGVVCSILCKRFNIPIISWLLRRYERKEYRNSFPGKGAIFFAAGVLLTLQLFRRDIALASIMILALGDSVSHIVGKNFGSTNVNGNGKKKLEGTIAGVAAGFAGALLFVNPLYALVGSIGGLFVESLEFDLNKRAVDDNIIVPVVAGTLMVLVGVYFGV